jgi:hypothetical protein
MGYMNRWSQLLQAVCNHYNVTPRRFLGLGKMGQCFVCARVEDGSEFAIKTVLTYPLHSHNRAAALAVQEFIKICDVNANNVGSTVRVDADSLVKFDRPGEPGKQLGISFAMTDIGSPMSRKGMCMQRMPPLLKSLAELHAVGHYHGDARVENPIMDRIKRIDSLTAECGTAYVNVMRDVGGKCVHWRHPSKRSCDAEDNYPRPVQRKIFSTVWLQVSISLRITLTH